MQQSARDIRLYLFMYKMYMITVLIFVFKRVSASSHDQHVAHAGSYLFDWNAYLMDRITPKCDAIYRC
jgi:hypothetical protein